MAVTVFPVIYVNSKYSIAVIYLAAMPEILANKTVKGSNITVHA